MNMSLDKTALRILSVFNCAAGGIILFLMLMTYAIGLFAVVGTWNLLEPDELLEVLEIGGCSLVLVIPGILMMGEGILTWMAVKDPSRISGACLLSGLMVGVCALPVALFSWMEDDARQHRRTGSQHPGLCLPCAGENKNTVLNLIILRKLVRKDGLLSLREIYRIANSPAVFYNE